CFRNHSTKTFSVETDPPSLHDALPISAAMSKVGFQTCQPKFVTTLGSTAENQHLTAYDFIFFAPTSAQRAAGARWVRCDLVLLGSASQPALLSDVATAYAGDFTDKTKR